MSLNSASSAGATHEDCKFIAGMTRPESVGAKTASPTKLPIFTACPRRFRSILSAKTFVKMPNILQVMGFFAPSSTSSGTLALNPLGPRVLNGTKRRQWTRTAVYLPTAAPLIPGVQRARANVVDTRQNGSVHYLYIGKRAKRVEPSVPRKWQHHRSWQIISSVHCFRQGGYVDLFRFVCCLVYPVSRTTNKLSIRFREIFGSHRSRAEKESIMMDFSPTF